MRILHLISFFNFTVLCLCEGEEAGEGEVDDSRIDVNAVEAEPHTYPFLVLINGTQGYAGGTRQSICHGVLVAPNIIMGTSIPACHKFPVRTLLLVAGMHNVQNFEPTVQRREICHIDIHPQANEPTRRYCYAMYHTSDPFVFNDYVKSVKFPMPEVTDLSGIPSCMFASHTLTRSIAVMREKEANVTSCPTNAHETNFCIDVTATDDAGAPLICNKGNREFAAGVYTSIAGGRERYFSAFYNKDFQNWYNEKVSTGPKDCAPKH